MNAEQAAALRAPMAAEDVDVLPKPTRKNAEKGKCPVCEGWHGLPAVHLDYAGHAAVTDRLLAVDPGWTWEPVPDPAGRGLPMPESGRGLWLLLTVAGVTRYGFGDAEGKTGANAVKEMIGDALRNAAMRFGVGLDLWRKEDKGRRQVEDDEPQQQPAPDPTAGWPVERILRAEIGKLGTAMGLSPDDLAARFASDHDGVFIGSAEEGALRVFLDDLRAEAAAEADRRRNEAAGDTAPTAAGDTAPW